MWKSVAANAMSLLIVGFIAFAGLIAWGQRQYTEQGPLATATYFEVPRGASLAAVSEDLAEAGIIDNATIFRLGARYTERAGALRFGNYEIPAEVSMDEIMEILTTGAATTARYTATYVIRGGAGGGEMRLREREPGSGEMIELASFDPGAEPPEAYAELVEAETPIVFRVVVPEGLTVWQIVEGLRGAEFLVDDVEDLPAEGTLAPDTYDVARGTTIGELLEEMADAQTGILLSAWSGRAEDLPYDTVEAALVMASLIEKETGIAGERREIAGVFVNRLEAGMRLQTDPTIIYGETEGRGFLGRGIRQSELANADNPWNTYQIDGLPPTPIANPGRDAIEAAVNPAETDNLFFVADGSGGHAFAATLEEHNRNVAVWRALEAERAAGED
ncbi:endolytic transglycosylase MltG [Rhodobacteraceae bacterium W635]|uniref:endolytic transglycosylase MltG n=1 Tax=Nioella halotolerans TaxID=2303578 RepID=UPI000E3EAB32|nr:endolytic transglycosylase MltG [Rhodobacteraceae bacterium W635]